MSSQSESLINRLSKEGHILRRGTVAQAAKAPDQADQQPRSEVASVTVDVHASIARIEASRRALEAGCARIRQLERSTNALNRAHAEIAAQLKEADRRSVELKQQYDLEKQRSSQAEELAAELVSRANELEQRLFATKKAITELAAAIDVAFIDTFEFAASTAVAA